VETNIVIKMAPKNSSALLIILVNPDIGTPLPCPTVHSVKKLKYRLSSKSFAFVAFQINNWDKLNE
jgi:hypothetical protein